MLNGYKTYIVAVVGALYAITAFLTGHIDANAATEMLVTALGLGALRNALANKA